MPGATSTRSPFAAAPIAVWICENGEDVVPWPGGGERALTCHVTWAPAQVTTVAKKTRVAQVRMIELREWIRMLTEAAWSVDRPREHRCGACVRKRGRPPRQAAA